MKRWEITDDLRELIIIGASAIELRKKAIECGMITLAVGTRKTAAGNYNS